MNSPFLPLSYHAGIRVIINISYSHSSLQQSTLADIASLSNLVERMSKGVDGDDNDEGFDFDPIRLCHTQKSLALAAISSSVLQQKAAEDCLRLAIYSSRGKAATSLQFFKYVLHQSRVQSLHLLLILFLIVFNHTPVNCYDAAHDGRLLPVAFGY